MTLQFFLSFHLDFKDVILIKLHFLWILNSILFNKHLGKREISEEQIEYFSINISPQLQFFQNVYKECSKNTRI